MTPKPKRWSFWLVSATALLSIGAWQAAQITVDAKTRALAKVKAPPKKTRSDGRKPLAKELAQADPVGTYLARAKRGMTDQEIGWMIEDFQEARLDHLPPPLPPLLRTFRSHQQAWYANALAEGLGLTQAQKHEMGISLRALLAAEFDEENHQDSSSISASTVLNDWLEKESYAPWNLCHLTEAQANLTVQKLVGKEAQDPFAPKSDARPTWGELLLSPPVVQDPLSGNPITVPAEGTSGSPSRNAALPGTGVFPLTPDQPTVALSLLGDRTLPGDLLQQARILQPSQLRMALLLRPGTAGELSRLLENPSPPLELPQGIRLSKPLQEELLRLLPRNQSTPQTPPDE